MGFHGQSSNTDFLFSARRWLQSLENANALNDLSAAALYLPFHRVLYSWEVCSVIHYPVGGILLFLWMLLFLPCEEVKYTSFAEH